MRAVHELGRHERGGAVGELQQVTIRICSPAACDSQYGSSWEPEFCPWLIDDPDRQPRFMLGDRGESDAMAS
jgi:hypothetical protein